MGGPELWYCGENGDGGFWIEPVQGEDVSKECVYCGVGVEGDCLFLIWVLVFDVSGSFGLYIVYVFSISVFLRCRMLDSLVCLCFV